MNGLSWHYKSISFASGVGSSITLLLYLGVLPTVSQAGVRPGRDAGRAVVKKPAVKPAAVKASATVNYTRDVRPILSNKCFACHGADPKAIQAGLRLDTREGAVATLGDGHRAIFSGSPQKSELVRRITLSPTSPLVMPPVDTKKALTAEEKRILTTWIAEGAEYKLHWAFVKPTRPALPLVRQKTWPKIGIDHFILARLEREGLSPSPQTDKTTLLRRVTLDLTGIPPTAQEAAAFTADRSANAYEKTVNRLLASPRYGERMAQSWMDCARYADSNGYQADYERFQWRWRDWVIDAFNKNMPFDQFTIEQIAGDMLPNATLSQKIATGFNRNHRINTEGGVIAEEWRVETVIDRVETTSAVWLGLTMGCARCHDHKYDPLTQKEFYQFCSYFNNVPESGSGEERPVNHPPFVSAPTSEQTLRLTALDADLQKAKDWLTQRESANGPQAAVWKRDGAQDDATLQSGIVARYRLAKASAVMAGSAPVPTPVGNVGAEAGRATGAVTLDGNSYLDLGNVGDFDTKDTFSYGAWVNPINGDGCPLAKMDSGKNFRGWDLFLAGGRPAVHLIDTWAGNALKVIAKPTIPNNQWTHLFATYDGSAKPEGIKLYINGKSVPFDVEVNALSGTIRTGVSAKIGTRTLTSGFAGKVDDVAIYKRVLSPAEVTRLAGADPVEALLAIAPDRRTDEQKLQIARLWSERNDADYRQRAEERNRLAKERELLNTQISTVMVMGEMPKPRDCYILVRGQYDKHGDKVEAGLPVAFGGLPKGAPNNRLGLAAWIASPDNPLTARVAVNRLWEKFFGVGIVATTEDFGTRAEYPAHPELLDWLATEFVRLKWDLKAMQKEMVMSAVYQQSSKVTPRLVQRDPDNRLLARGPRFRLPAEVIRDQALAVSGLLVEKVGGPSVRPYQPDGVWDELNVYGNLRNYKHDTGDNLYRRSLYTIWKRTSAPPMQTLFDVPGREMCRVRRSRTNTPLQALALMNDVTFVEASRVLAQRMLTEGGVTPEQRLSYAFRRTLGRAPSADETRILTGGLRKFQTRYGADPQAALKLVGQGDTPRDPKLDTSELAAYTMTASILLNMDETITKE